MKVVLCYVGGLNLGDGVIAACTRYLLDGIFRGLGVAVDYVDLDIGQQPKPSEPTRHTRGQDFVLHRLARWAPVLHSRLLWKWSAGRREFAARELVKLEGAELIVFVGGGIIKFRHQKFHRHLDDITAWADAHAVPVLFNAVGVEGYDRTDLRCRVLQHAINRRCVRLMTTRDDLGLLAGKYVGHARLRLCAVADPALWTPEAFGLARAAAVSPVVGLNVIRSDIFGEYLYPVDPDALMALYCGLIGRLVASGRKVELFTNGGNRDGHFIEEFLNRHPDVASHPSVSVFRPKDPAALVARIAAYERFLAVRLHAAIIGTSLGVPNVSLVWSDKQIFFGEAVGARENFLRKDDFDAGTVFDRLMSARSVHLERAYKDTVRETLGAVVTEIVRNLKKGEKK